MARLPEDFISQIKSANDIVDMFRTYADVKKHGRVYTCCCPFHSEKTPSCTIYPESSSFYCFGCHVGGDVIKFVMLTDNVSYMEAVRILAQRSGLTIPSSNPEEIQQSKIRGLCYEINRETANFYYQNLLQSADKKGLQFLKAKHIFPSAVKKYAVGYAPDEPQKLYRHLRQKGFSDYEISASGLCQEHYDYFQNSLIFPAVDFRGNVAAFGGMSIRSNPPVFLYTKNTPASNRNQLIFSMNFAKKEANTHSVILAENYFNVIVLYQAGFPNIVAVPDSLTKAQIKILSQYAKEIILIQTQSAHFGDLQTVQNFISEAEMQVKVLNLQEKSSSAEWIQAFGAEAFRKRLTHADDAVQTALQESWNGLDQEQDKTVVMQQAAHVLANIQNALEREVYLSETAQKLNLSIEQLQAQIDYISGKPAQITFPSSRSLTPEELNFSGKQELS